MNYHQHVIETIGNTPLVQLNQVTKGISGTILVKLEYMNPGNSMKDRIGLQMILDAEEQGLIKPGGTIIEGTSGNTGMGLALAAIARGYRCIFTVSDKQSQEKIDILRAVGAEVIVCPTNVPADDPRSYYSVARKLNEDIPNSFYPNQYDNPSNAKAHYLTTGPEIWKDTKGKITHYVAGVGTGGSMCGTSRFLKEQNPEIVTVGIDSYGSVFKKYKETGIFDENEIYPYLTEGIGEDILPRNVNFDLIDTFIKVTDKDAAIMTRRLAREEGLFVGWSCGSAVHGALEYARNALQENDIMVIILPDHGTRYLGKIYNDAWMQDHGFLEDHSFPTAKEVIAKRKNTRKLIQVQQDVLFGEAIRFFNQSGVSQIPILDGQNVVGSLTEKSALQKLITNPELRDKPVSELMDKPFTFVSPDSTADVLASMLNEKTQAVLVRDNDQVHIITRHDVLEALNF